MRHLFDEHKIAQQCGVDFVKFIDVYEAINHDLWHKYSLQLTTKSELRYQRFYRAFLEFGLDDLELAHVWANDYLKLSPYKTHLIEGAREVLDYLKPKYALHIITNGFKEVQDIKLESCSLTGYFDQVIISEEYGFNKPDRQIFQLAENLAGTKSEHCVMIGDNFDTDIAGAINANWQAIHLTDQTQSRLPDNSMQIKKLEELLELF